MSPSLSCVLCLSRQVMASNDASLLYHKLFSSYGHIPRHCSLSSLSLYHPVSQEFMSLSHSAFALEALRNALYKFKTYLLLRLYAEGIHFSTHDLTNFTVYMGCCSSSCCFHPPCPKSLDWIDIQSNWFSLTFSRSTFQTIPAFECPLSSTSMFLRHTIQIRVFTILFFNSNFIFPLSNSPRLLNAAFPTSP